MASLHDRNADACTPGMSAAAVAAAINTRDDAIQSTEVSGNNFRDNTRMHVGNNDDYRNSHTYPSHSGNYRIYNNYYQIPTGKTSRVVVKIL